jgi:hypothetical protein
LIPCSANELASCGDFWCNEQSNGSIPNDTTWFGPLHLGCLGQGFVGSSSAVQPPAHEKLENLHIVLCQSRIRVRTAYHGKVQSCSRPRVLVERQGRRMMRLQYLCGKTPSESVQSLCIVQGRSSLFLTLQFGLLLLLSQNPSVSKLDYEAA